MKRLLYFLREENYVTVRKNDVNKALLLLYEKYSSFIFYHISLLNTHFNEWNTPQTKKLSGALAIVIEGFMIWGSKCYQNNSTVICDSYVK